MSAGSSRRQNSMTTVTVTIDDAKAAALREKAKHYGLPLEELLLASMESLVTQPEPDFQQAMKHVLGKNRELYRRLA